MPCGCFGGKKAKKNDNGKEPPLEVKTGAPFDAKPKGEDDPSSKRQHIVASDYGRECSLLGYRDTGSRPPSSNVDSPNSNSLTQTPSTIPAAASSASSRSYSSDSLSKNSRNLTNSRAHLAEKRREFFRELYPPEEGKAFPLPSTLPTIARAKQFGKVKSMRPLSQPTQYDSHVPEAPPPGPHLLRHCDASRVSPKIDMHADDSGSGFASPQFLRELKEASDEVSKRWTMSDEERNCSSPSFKKNTVNMSENWQHESEFSNGSESCIDTLPQSINNSFHSQSTIGLGLDLSSQHFAASGCPEVCITPSSPLIELSEESSHSFSVYTDRECFEEKEVSTQTDTVQHSNTNEPTKDDHFPEGVGKELDSLLMEKLNDDEDSFELTDVPAMEKGLPDLNLAWDNAPPGQVGDHTEPKPKPPHSSEPSPGEMLFLDRNGADAVCTGNEIKTSEIDISPKQ